MLLTMMMRAPKVAQRAFTTMHAPKVAQRAVMARTMSQAVRSWSSSSSSSSNAAAAAAAHVTPVSRQVLEEESNPNLIPPMTVEEFMAYRKTTDCGKLGRKTEEELREIWGWFQDDQGKVDMPKLAMKNPVGISLHHVLKNVDASVPGAVEEATAIFNKEKDEFGQVYVPAADIEGDMQQPCDIRHGDFLSAVSEFVPDQPGWGVTYLANPPKRKRSKYPVPPVADCPGIILPESMNPEYNPDLPFTLDRSEGVTVIEFKEGHPYHKHGEMVLGAMQMTLEWVLPSPPPLHTYDEQPIIKQRPSWEDDGSFTYGDH